LNHREEFKKYEEFKEFKEMLVGTMISKRTVTVLEIRVAQRRPHIKKMRVNPRTKLASQATDPTRIPSHPSNSAVQPNQVLPD
jgi:hypothetical protein